MLQKLEYIVELQCKLRPHASPCMLHCHEEGGFLLIREVQNQGLNTNIACKCSDNLHSVAFSGFFPSSLHCGA